MYTKEDLGKLGLSVKNESEEDNKEKSLKWLLEMDLSEPEEQLFTVADNEYEDAGLSASEAEVAARPLVRGNAKGDDLSNYVDEEIVISSDNAAGDIFSEVSADDAESEDGSHEGLMAIDYSSDSQGATNTAVGDVDEGTDILGLGGEDDIGEKYLAIKRVKRVRMAAANDAQPVESADSAPEVTAPEVMAPEVMAPEVTAAESISMADPAVEEVADDAGDVSVTDYVSSTPEPQDEDDFDKYLLAGEHLEDGEADPEELALELRECDEDLVSEDSGAIDYHDDFLALEGFSENASAEIAPVIGPVMEEISASVAARLDALGENPGDVTVDVRVGADEASVQQCRADGFEQVSAICRELPQALQSLSQEVQDAIYVRLQNTVCDESWNDLFSEEFAVGRGAVQAEHTDFAADSTEVDLSQDGGFGEDIFGDDFNDEFSAQLEANSDAQDMDIEEVFSGLEHMEEDSVAGIGNDELVQAASPDLAEPVVIDEISAVAVEATVAEEMPGQAESEVESEPVAETAFSGEIALEEVAPEEIVSEEVVPEEVVPAEVVSEEEPEPVGAEQVASESVIEELAVADKIAAQEDAGQAEPAADETDVKEAAAVAIDNAYPDNFIPDYIEFNYTSQSNAEIFADFLDAFIEEGSVEVEKLEHEVGEWEKEIDSESLFANVSRTLHTIKGIAKGVGLQRLGTLVHNFETLLDKLPKPAGSDQQDYFRVVNAWLDSVVRGFEHVQSNRADIDSELPVHPEKVSAGVQVEVQVEEEATVSKTAESEAEPESQAKPEVEARAKAEAETARKAKEEAASEPEQTDNKPETVKPKSSSSALDKKRDKQLADEGAKVLAAQQSVRITSEKLDHLLNLTSQVQQLGVRASQSTSRSKRSSAELQARLSSVRTHIRKIADRALLNVNAQPGKSAPDLDALEMDQYSELQEAANILREGVEDLTDLVDVLTRQNIQIEALLKQQSSVISSISSSIQGARVVPVSRLMPGLRRIVRTVSTDLGKVVSFQVLNETGALDRDHYARLQVILEHMVRNALDHGVESPEERVAVGKPTGGRITVDVRKSGGDYVIRLTDDGRGIDPDAIRQSALQKGIDVDVDELSDDEAIRLIFHKGFSTASKLSEISGRGVGMDIVMTELQQLGGSVEIQSAIGLGTAFEVRIPSNVSVNGALLVAAGGESYAIPLNGLIGVEQVPVEEFFSAVEKRQKLNISDMECEATYLATLCQGVPLPDRGVWSSFVPVIVAGAEERCMAIAIDNLEEALELVVRSMGTQFSLVPGVAGAATTAEGEAIVALDLNLMVLSAGEDGVAPVAVSQTQADAPLALVVDDSRTQRMVATSQLESVGVETITAENGLVAIDLLNATHRLPDVILLDVEMPVKDGIETLREIRKSSRYGDLPVIMVTSRTGAKHRALASEAGCNAYMGKPFNFAALTKQINDLTGLELQVS